MEDSKLVKVEIGCGKSKNEGFIGIDRYPLPGVDIVADVNKGLPFDADTVDIVWACHSLEHMDDIVQVFNEIYRICKHKSVIMVLAPYFFSTANISNPYHRSCYTEDTPRFFSDFKENNLIPYFERDCPHACVWGLAMSDNSEFSSEIQTLHIEYFYFEEYRHLSESEKSNARRALMNVCDQVYYVLAVNKSNTHFTEIEIEALLDIARNHEPEIVNSFRDRDTYLKPDKCSFLRDMSTPLNVRIDEVKTDIDGRIAEIETDIDGRAAEIETGVEGRIADVRNSMLSCIDEAKTALEEQYHSMLSHIDKVKIDLDGQITDVFHSTLRLSDNIKGLEILVADLSYQHTSEYGTLSVLLLEIIKRQEKKSGMFERFSFFRKKIDMYPLLREMYIQFTDDLIMQCNNFRDDSVLTLSHTLPYTSYVEYKVEGFGKVLYFFLIATLGSSLLIEVVANNIIIKQEVVTIKHEGPHQIALNESISGGIYVRFKAMTNGSIIRILETVSRKYLFFARRQVASHLM